MKMCTCVDRTRTFQICIAQVYMTNDFIESPQRNVAIRRQWAQILIYIYIFSFHHIISPPSHSLFFSPSLSPYLSSGKKSTSGHRQCAVVASNRSFKHSPSLPFTGKRKYLSSKRVHCIEQLNSFYFSEREILVELLVTAADRDVSLQQHTFYSLHSAAVYTVYVYG